MKLTECVHQYDVRIFRWCMQLKHYDRLALVSQAISRSGDGQLYALAGLVALLVDEPEARLFLFSGVLGFAVERLLYLIMKNGFKRNRPADALQGVKSQVTPSDQFSFPSGHTSAAFLMATLTSELLPPCAPLAYLWATSVGISRIFLGVHFPSDVVMGMMMGTTIAISSIEVFTL